MFVYNLKVNGSKVYKVFFSAMVIFLVIIVCVVTFKMFSGASNSKDTCMPNNQITKLTTNNYTNVLKTVHENIDSYIGLKINFTGYVYRVLDLKDNQFILSRDMIISSDRQSVIVGFLCEYDEATNFNDSTWVEVTGEIIKGDYHGEMPIVKVTEIKNTDKPNDEFVYPPDESYIPTNEIL